MNFYHFTSKYHLPYILTEGLTRGDVPLSPLTGTKGIWLTTEGRPHKQKYNRLSHFLHMGQKHTLDKAEIRLLININQNDPRFFFWPDAARLLNIDKKFYDGLNVYNENEAYWHIYFGTIPTTSIVRIDRHVGNGKWEELTDPGTLPRLQIKFASSEELKGNKITRIPQEEILQQLEVALRQKINKGGLP